MDQSLLTLFSSSGSLGLIGLLLIEIYKLYSKTKTDDQSRLVLDLTAHVSKLEILVKENEEKITVLQNQIFELKEENAILKGLIKSQETKEEMVEKYVKKKTKTVK